MLQQDGNRERLLIFAVAGYNLAETGRMIEIARAAREFFNVRFLSYGGQFEGLIEEEGFAPTRMESRLTRRKLDRLRVVLSGETLNTVDTLLGDETAKSKVIEFRSVLKQWDGPANAAGFLRETFGKSESTEVVRATGRGGMHHHDSIGEAPS